MFRVSRFCATWSERLINGTAVVTTVGAVLAVEWNHEMPDWTRDYCFTSKVSSSAPTRYVLVVTPQQR